MLVRRPGRPWIVAHRGASGLAPENTREAFERAIECGAEWIETDLRRTADGVVVLFHDATVPGAPPRAVHELTFAELSARRAVERWDEVLPLLAGRVGLDVEIKRPGCEAQVVASLRAACAPGTYLVSSFDERVLRTVRRLDPALPTALILSGHGLGGRLLGRRRNPRGLLRHAAAGGLVLHHALAGGPLAGAARRAGLPWHVWTVNTPELAHSLARAGAWSVITDRPDLLA